MTVRTWFRLWRASEFERWLADETDEPRAWRWHPAMEAWLAWHAAEAEHDTHWSYLVRSDRMTDLTPPIDDIKF